MPQVFENRVYDTSLGRVEGGFQWSLALESVITESLGKEEVRNRPWRSVGPVLTSRETAIRWREQDGHFEALTREYDEQFGDEIETMNSISREHQTFSAMSGARSRRFQVSTTPDIYTWLEGQALPKESISQTVHRLLAGLAQ